MTEQINIGNLPKQNWEDIKPLLEEAFSGISFSLFICTRLRDENMNNEKLNFHFHTQTNFILSDLDKALQAYADHCSGYKAKQLSTQPQASVKSPVKVAKIAEPVEVEKEEFLEEPVNLVKIGKSKENDEPSN